MNWLRISVIFKSMCYLDHMGIQSSPLHCSPWVIWLGVTEENIRLRWRHCDIHFPMSNPDWDKWKYLKFRLSAIMLAQGLVWLCVSIMWLGWMSCELRFGILLCVTAPQRAGWVHTFASRHTLTEQDVKPNSPHVLA